VRDESEPAQSGDKGEIQLLVSGVVGDIDERGVGGKRPLAPGARPWGRLQEARSQQTEEPRRVLALRVAGALRHVLDAASLRRASPWTLGRRWRTIASINATISRARFFDTPTSLAVSSMDGTGVVISALIGIPKGTQPACRGQ